MDLGEGSAALGGSGGGECCPGWIWGSGEPPWVDLGEGRAALGGSGGGECRPGWIWVRGEPPWVDLGEGSDALGRALTSNNRGQWGRVGFLVYRELGEYNWVRGCSRPGLSPPGRVNNSRLAVGPQSTEVQIFEVNCSYSGTFGNDYVFKRVYFGRCILKDQ